MSVSGQTLQNVSEVKSVHKVGGWGACCDVKAVKDCGAVEKMVLHKLDRGFGNVSVRCVVSDAAQAAAEAGVETSS